MTHSSTAIIAAHLISSLGMNASVLEDAQLRRAIRRRMEAASLRSVEAYAGHYRSSPAEQAALAEEIYIHETCFFRDSAVFTETVHWVRQWLATHDGPISILSAPCSTGEEPYSIAAALLEAELPSESVVIHAVDVSENALNIARQGVYRGLSLRNLPHPETEIFLESVETGWKVRPEVASMVSFHQVNLLDADALPPAAYELIFCRNLLIYLDPTARLRVAEQLRRSLRPSGRLVLGAADWSTDLQPFFRAYGPPNAFAFSPAAPAATGRSGPSRKISGEMPAAGRPVRRTNDAQALYERALDAVQHDQALAERFCRQALYLQNDHLPSLELLSRLWRSRASHRLNHALDARLRRRRLAVREAV